MQVPSILQGESRTRLIQGMVIGAVASMVIGFSWGGWLLGSTAHRLAADQASTAVVAVLTPICVEKFLQNSDAQANLAALREISTNWQQGQYLEKGGWATRPGATSTDYELASSKVRRSCPGFSGSMRARYICAAHCGQSGRALMGVLSSVYSVSAIFHSPVCRREYRSSQPPTPDRVAVGDLPQYDLFPRETEKNRSL